MRVLLTHVFCWPEVRRGGERYLHELAASLQRRGHEVTVLSTEPQARTDDVLGVHTQRLRRRRFPPKSRDPLAEEAGFGLQSLAYAAWHRPDVWHALGTADAWAATVLGARRPALVTAFTDLGIPDRLYREGRSDRRRHSRVVGAIGDYVCLSSFAAESLVRDFGRTGTVVAGGVDVASFPVTDAREPRPTVLYSGTLDDPRKNVAELLATAVRLRARIPDLQVWLSGPGDADALIAQVPGAEHVVAAAGLDDAAALTERYRRSWVTALPSHHEAFGLALVESLASGTPVLARRDSGSRDVVTPEIGVTVAADVWDDDLATALDLARRPDIADACRTRALEFDWDTRITPMLEASYGV